MLKATATQTSPNLRKFDDVTCLIIKPVQLSFTRVCFKPRDFHLPYLVSHIFKLKLAFYLQFKTWNSGSSSSSSRESNDLLPCPMLKLYTKTLLIIFPYLSLYNGSSHPVKIVRVREEGNQQVEQVGKMAKDITQQVKEEASQRTEERRVMPRRLKGLEKKGTKELSEFLTWLTRLTDK